MHVELPIDFPARLILHDTHQPDLAGVELQRHYFHDIADGVAHQVLRVFLILVDAVVMPVLFVLLKDL